MSEPKSKLESNSKLLPKSIYELSEENLLLVEKAKEASLGSYSPMSGFPVGAALLIEDQNNQKQFVKGTNYETQNYRSVCAEKHALQSAHLNYGHKDKFPKLFKIAIFSPNSSEPIVPCGDCRQALFEQNPDLEVLCIGANHTYREFKVCELLPFGFRLNEDSIEGQSHNQSCSQLSEESLGLTMADSQIKNNIAAKLLPSKLRDYIVHFPIIEDKFCALSGLECLIVVGSPARAQKLSTYFSQRFSSAKTQTKSNNDINWGIAEIVNYCHIVNGNTDREYSLFIIHWPDVNFKVGIASHGIGASGMEIVLSEINALIALANLESNAQVSSPVNSLHNLKNENIVEDEMPLKAVIRSGTRGTIANVNLGTIAITTKAYSEREEILPNADLTEQLERAAKELNVLVDRGACLSAQFFWSGQGRTPFPLLRKDNSQEDLDTKNNAYLRSLQAKDIKWIEMEDYYLHYFASEYGMVSASLGLVVAKRYDEVQDQFLLSYDIETKKDKELLPAEIALLSLKNFFSENKSQK